MRKKVAIIGLDGMYWGFFKRICEDGFMPYINSKINRGIRGTLISTFPPYTPPAWNSIASGVYPNKHGIWGFFNVKKTKKEFKLSISNSYNLKYPRIWEMLSFFNKKSIIVNIPTMYPFKRIPKSENYILASGWDSPKVDIYPKKLYKKYKNLLLPYLHNWSRFSDKRNYINSLTEILEARTSALLDLADNTDWDLLFIVFSEPDWLLHRFVYGEKSLHHLSKIFRIIDRTTQAIANEADLTILISDHGFDLFNARFRVNSFFMQKHIVSFSVGYDTDLTKDEKLRKTRLKWLGKYVELAIKRNLLIKYGLKGLYFFNKKAYIKALRLFIRLFKFKYTIDESTIAFSPEFGVVYVKKGYTEYVKKILEETNYVNVLKTSELFSFVRGNAPDLIILAKNKIIPASHIAPHANIIEKELIPYHSMRGLFFAITDEIPSRDIGIVNTVDLVPTILSFMGLPIPSDTDGKILFEEYKKNLTKYDYYIKWKIINRVKKIERTHRKGAA